MQIDRGFLKVAMPQQHLDGTQVGACFEQMRGKAVAQSVGMDVLVLKAGAFGGLLTGVPENLGGDRMTRCMPWIAGEQPVGGLALQPAPVDTRNASSSFGLSMTSRSFRPLPPRIWMTMRWLSISRIFRCATSARRAPVAYSVISRMR